MKTSTDIYTARSSDMRLYTSYTESHRPLLCEFFMPSLLPDEYLLTVRQFKQSTPTGSIKEDDGFAETVRERTQMCIDAVRTAQAEGDEYFVHADCDLQFFARTRDTLVEMMQEGYDLIAQNDYRRGFRPKDGKPRLCTGFYICRASDTMLAVFEEMLQLIRPGFNDQHALNAVKTPFRARALGNRFFSVRQPWRPGLPLRIPRRIVLHHANWTVGITNKLIMMNQVRNAVWLRRGFALLNQYQKLNGVTNE